MNFAPAFAMPKSKKNGKKGGRKRGGKKGGKGDWVGGAQTGGRFEEEVDGPELGAKKCFKCQNPRTEAKGAGVKGPTRNLTKSLVKLGEEVNGMVGEEITDMVWVNGKLMMSKTFVDGMESKHVQKTKNGTQSGGRRRRRSS